MEMESKLAISVGSDDAFNSMFISAEHVDGASAEYLLKDHVEDDEIPIDATDPKLSSPFIKSRLGKRITDYYILKQIPQNVHRDQVNEEMMKTIYKADKDGNRLS